MSLATGNKRASGLNFGSPVEQFISGSINGVINSKERATRLGLHDFSTLTSISDILHSGPPFLDFSVPMSDKIDRFHSMIIHVYAKILGQRIDRDVRDP